MKRFMFPSLLILVAMSTGARAERLGILARYQQEPAIDSASDQIAEDVVTGDAEGEIIVDPDSSVFQKSCIRKFLLTIDVEVLIGRKVGEVGRNLEGSFFRVPVFPKQNWGSFVH